MAKYQYAKPFDFVRDFKALQDAVKALQLRSGTVGPWQQAAMQNGWTGTLNYRRTDRNEIQFSAHSLTPGTISAGILIAIVTLTPQGPHEFQVMTSGAVGAGSPRIALDISGNLNLSGVTTGSDLSIEAIVPLDI
jgi:hypothetical protein